MSNEAEIYKRMEEDRREADALWDELLSERDATTQLKLRQISIVADAERSYNALKAALRYIPEGTEEYRGAILAIEKHEAGR